jgi:hypothetical protein
MFRTLEIIFGFQSKFCSFVACLICRGNGSKNPSWIEFFLVTAGVFLFFFFFVFCFGRSWDGGGEEEDGCCSTSSHRRRERGSEGRFEYSVQLLVALFVIN